MGTVSPFTFTSTTETVTKDKLNNLTSTLVTEFNGSIDNNNIKAAAGIAGSKLDLATVGAIGTGTPAAGTFTDLTTTGNTVIGDGSGDALTINPAAWTLANAVTITGTFTDLGTVTTADINGGTIDGVTIGAASAPTITDLGSVATCDINGGSIDGTNIGAAAQGTAHVSTLKVGTTNQGDVLYDNGTSLVRLTPGTSGLFLKTQGAAANPVWGNPASSNVLFGFSAILQGTGATTEGALNTDNGSSPIVSYSSQAGGFANIWQNRWTKIAGIDTLNLIVRAKGTTVGTQVKITISALNSTITINQTSYTYGDGTLDVSSLSDGTDYDIVLSQHNNNTSGPSNIQAQYTDAFTIIGQE